MRHLNQLWHWCTDRYHHTPARCNTPRGFDATAYNDLSRALNKALDQDR